MQSKKTWMLIASVALMVVLMVLPFSAACAGGGAAPTPGAGIEQGVFQLKMTNTYPPLHRLTPDAFHWWGKEIEKRTNGRVSFVWFDGGTLAAGPDAYEAVRDGIADGGVVDLLREDPLFSLLEIGSVPYILQNSWQGSPANWELYQSSAEMQKVCSDAGVRPVWIHLTDIFNIHTTEKLIKTPADCPGQILYAPGTMWTKICESSGAKPINFPWTDAYEATQRGMLTGFFWPWAPIRSTKMTDLLPNHTVLNIAMTPWAGFMNPATWNSLPPDIQKVFDDLSLSMCALCGATLTNEASDIIKEMEEKGHNFYTPQGAEREEWVSLTGKPIEDAWVKQQEDAGYADAKDLLAKFRQLAEKYKDEAYGFDDWWGLAGRVWLLEK